MDMEFKKLCSIIVEVLGVDESEITLDMTTFHALEAPQSEPKTGEEA